MSGAEGAVLETALADLGLALPGEVRNRLLEYFGLLQAANRRLNLVSARQDRPTQVLVHLVDSLTPLLWADWPDEPLALDIGAGGGLPSLPLALARPGWRWTLAEATGKKASFLEEAIKALNLERVRVLNRFLAPGRNEEGAFYDLALARAVADLGRLAALAGPRLKPGGQLLAFKGPLGEDELKRHKRELARRGFDPAPSGRLELTLPEIGARRLLLRFTKI